jgi:hypothetical protein
MNAAVVKLIDISVGIVVHYEHDVREASLPSEIKRIGKFIALKKKKKKG